MLSLRWRSAPTVRADDTLAAGEWRLRGLGKSFGAMQALHEVGFTIGEGEIVSVTGPSGAGKSTLGRLLSGLERCDAGEIVLGGRDIGALPARLRRVAHMFESFALYPTRSVAQNVASPLQAPSGAGRWTAAECEQRIAEVLQLTEMSALAARLPSQLSGGQKQRVALCRALVQDPSLYVLDEPIGHLDARLRHQLRGAIRRRQGQLRPGTLWITPDGVEAMAVADRMVVLIGGRVQQVGAPADVFARPANVAVARLLGDPAMNVLAGRLRIGESATLVLAEGAHTAPVPVSHGFVARFGVRARSGRLQLGLRPAELRLLPAEAPAVADQLPGTVYAVEPLGKHTLVSVDVAGQRLRVKTAPSEAPWSVGAPVRIAFALDQTLSFDADSGVLQP